jgi:maltoporin
VVHKIFEGPSKLQNQLVLIPLFLSISLSAGLAQFISGGPQPGDIYKEFMLNLSQNNTSWRVTDPGATYVGEPGNSLQISYQIQHTYLL